jgi:uncharacterized protein (DUF2062 family)
MSLKASVPQREDLMEKPLQDQDHATQFQPEWPNVPAGRLRRLARYLYHRFIRLHGSPEEIAWGAAVGFFVAMSPTMGFQTCLAVPVAAFFKINKVAAAATVWLTNPVTAPFIYGFNYMIGAKLLGYPLNAVFFSRPSWETFWHGSAEVLLCLVIGGTLSGLVVSLAGYFVTLWMVRTAREKTRQIRQKKEQ